MMEKSWKIIEDHGLFHSENSDPLGPTVSPRRVHVESTGIRTQEMLHHLLGGHEAVLLEDPRAAGAKVVLDPGGIPGESQGQGMTKHINNWKVSKFDGWLSVLWNVPETCCEKTKQGFHISL